MIRLIGAVAVLVAALSFVRMYRAYLGTRVKQFDDFCVFLHKIRRSISTRLLTLEDCILGITEGELVRIGFVEKYGELRRVHPAFTAVKDKLYLTKKGLEILDGYLAVLGHGYLEEELRLSDECIRELEAESRASRDEGERSLRVASAFAVAAAVGITVLLV